MATLRRFEIIREDAGLVVYARTTWGAQDARRSVNGPACPDPFRTLKAAMVWVELQFSVPPEAWVRGQGDCLMSAEIGPPTW